MTREVRTIDHLERLVSFDTTSEHSNLELIEYIRAELCQLDFRVILLPSGDGQNKAGLYAEIGPPGGGIVLSAHTDVVPASARDWTHDPFTLTTVGDRHYGRGTTDMKGFIACMLRAAKLASDADRLQQLNAPLKLVFSYDEEIGCVGMAEMSSQLEPLIGRPQLCIIGEPSSMKLGLGHKGKLAAEAHFHGQNGHSALAPLYVNALHMAGDFQTALRHLQGELAQSGVRDEAYRVPYSTVHVGLLRGGQALNIVPNLATLKFEVRHLIEDDPEQIFLPIEAAVRAIESSYREQYSDAEVVVEIINRYPGLDTEPQVPAVSQFMTRTGISETTKLSFGSEAGFFAAMGIPSVICGPGSMEGQGHQPDEYVETDQLVACEEMLSGVVDWLME